MLRRQLLTGAARLALAGMLFAQAALAVAGCVLETRSAALAVTVASSGGSEPCHDDDTAASGALCVVHCATSSQTPDKPPHPLPVLAAGVHAGFLALAPRAAPLALREAPHPVSGPPRRILYRTLLI
jgi:hypothetical protein